MLPLPDDYAGLLYTMHLCRIYAAHPPLEPCVATLCRAIRTLNSASQPPLIDKRHKGHKVTQRALYSCFHERAFVLKIEALYTWAIERSVDLMFDFSSIFRGA